MKTLVFIFSAVLLASPSLRADDCEGKPRPQLCREMKQMRSGVVLLESQREMLQVNYAWLQVIGTELEQVATAILRKMSSDQHMGVLNNVKDLARRIAMESERKAPEALSLANQMRFQCMACHAPTGNPPGSDPSWDLVFGEYNWDKVIEKCNAFGRNPYLCRSMNALMSAYQYIERSHISGTHNFEGARHATLEIQRLASDLRVRGMLHGSETVLKSVESDAIQLAKAFSEKDLTAYDRAKSLMSSCAQCHTR